MNFVGPPRPFTSTVDGRAQWVLGTRLTSCITSLESSFNAHVLAICWVCVAQVQKRVELNSRHFIYLSQEEVDLFPRNFEAIKGKHIEHITQRIHGVRSASQPGKIQVCKVQGLTLVCGGICSRGYRSLDGACAGQGEVT